MAARLSKGLSSLGYTLPHQTDANAVFVRLSPPADELLRSRGHGYYPFGPDGLIRLMCSFNTEAADVEAFLADAGDVPANLRRV
jgi:threonine aldolase